MDLVLNVIDHYLLTPYVYPVSWEEDDMTRQAISLYCIVLLSNATLYLTSTTLNYCFIFDKELMKHPRFLKNQIRREISQSILFMMPSVAIFFFPLYLLEVRGYSRLHMDSVSDSLLGIFSIPLNVIVLLVFSDFLEYWIHRGMHHPLVYRYLHKTHHTWKVPSPFAAHALSPIDAFLEGLPYHILPFIFPIHKIVYLAFMAFVSIWAVSIHDGDFRVPEVLQPYINGSAHHAAHHLYYNYNYGNFFTFWDRVCGSYRTPAVYAGNSPSEEVTELQYSQLKKQKMNNNGVNADRSSKPTTTTDFQHLRQREP